MGNYHEALHTPITRLKETLRGYPSIDWVLRGLLKTLRSLGTFIRLLSTELHHTVASYRILKDLDLLIASGGGQLDDYWGGCWGHPYTLFKWSLLAKATRTDFMFLSVGACSLTSLRTRFFLRTALKFASYRSYRDAGTKRLLAQMPFTRSDPVYPDLAFSYSPQNTLDPVEIPTPRPVVGISPIAYLSGRWPKTDSAVYESYIQALSSFVMHLIQQKYTVIFFATDSPDTAAIRQILTVLEGCGITPNSTLMAPVIDNLGDLSATLRQLDYVVASRLHGILLSHTLTTPVLAISYDPKVETHMLDMEQSDYCLDIHTLGLGDLLHRFERLTANRHHIVSQLGRAVARRKAQLDEQYDSIASSCSAGATTLAASVGC